MTGTVTLIDINIELLLFLLVNIHWPKPPMVRLLVSLAALLLLWKPSHLFTILESELAPS